MDRMWYPSPKLNHDDDGGRMTAKERVMSTLAHQKPDRPPMQISYTQEFRKRLQIEYPGLKDIVDPHGIDIALGCDLLLTGVGWMNSYNQPESRYIDEWNVGWRAAEYQTAYGAGRYTEVDTHPLSDDAAISSYRPPDPHRSELYDAAKQLVAQNGTEYWITGVVKTTIFECAWALRGLEQLMMDFYLDADVAHAILDIPYAYHVEAAKHLVEIGVDMIWIGDDVGSQHGMMISPETWRTFLKPRMASFITSLRSIRKDIVIAYHSDGVITPIIDELIEIGVDVLNPIQPNCMDPLTLKKQFGSRLSFWGGIDQQQILPFATPDAVYANTKEMISVLGKDGGYIAGPTHNVQLDVPLDNLRMMILAITGK